MFCSFLLQQYFDALDSNFLVQKQNVERAKSMLLGDNTDNKNALQQSNTQSDHLLLAVTYDKWAKILYQVIIFSILRMRSTIVLAFWSTLLCWR